MALTALATGNALTKKAWEERLMREAVIDSFFSRFMGKGPMHLVHVKEKLENKKGDQITFGLRARLSGDGVTGNETLEGKEEALSLYSDSVTLERYRHAVRDDGDLSRQRAAFDIDEESTLALKDWMSEKIDKLCFTAMENAPTKTFYLDSSADIAANASFATAKAALHATNSKLTLDLLTAIKASAISGGGRSYEPIKPVKIGGKSHYVFLTHPDALYDLRVSSDFKQAMREAEMRGKENPLFTGAVAVWNNVIIHEHENVSTFTDGGGGSVAGCNGYFMGQQSLIWADGKRPKVTQKKFDYDEQHGYSIAMTAKTKKPVFNSSDYGSLGVALARTNISGL